MRGEDRRFEAGATPPRAASRSARASHWELGTNNWELAQRLGAGLEGAAPARAASRSARDSPWELGTNNRELAQRPE